MIEPRNRAVLLMLAETQLQQGRSLEARAFVSAPTRSARNRTRCGWPRKDGRCRGRRGGVRALSEAAPRGVSRLHADG
jgi:hypothetical protein